MNAQDARIREDVEDVLLRVFGRQKLAEMREAAAREFFGFCGMRCYREPEEGTGFRFAKALTVRLNRG